MAYLKGHGTSLSYGDGTSQTTISQRVSISGPSMEVGTVETTHLDSTWREHTYTIPSGGTLSMQCEYDPDSTTQSGLSDLVATPDVVDWVLTFTDTTPTTYSFEGILTKFELGGMEVDGVTTADIDIQVTGAVIIA